MRIERVKTKGDAQRVARTSGGTPGLEKDLYQELENLGDGQGLYVRYTENFLQKMRVTKQLMQRVDVEEIMNRPDTWEFGNNRALKNWADAKPVPAPGLVVFQYVIKTRELTLWNGRQFRLELTAENYMDEFIFFYGSVSTEAIE